MTVPSANVETLKAVDFGRTLKVFRKDDDDDNDDDDDDDYGRVGALLSVH